MRRNPRFLHLRTKAFESIYGAWKDAHHQAQPNGREILAMVDEASDFANRKMMQERQRSLAAWPFEV